MQNEISSRTDVLFTIQRLKSLGTRLLSMVGIPCPELEVDILLEHVLHLSRIALHTECQKTVLEQDAVQFFSQLKARLTFKPMAYITGEKEFYGLPLYVDEHCLIPRPDTESVVEAALRIMPEETPLRLLDLCCGSGAIGIALLAHRPKVFAMLSDISEGALAIAKKNVVRHSLSPRIKIQQSDLFSALNVDEPFDVIVSNPPYLSEKELTQIATDLTFEPSAALFGGDKEGLFFYRQIFTNAKKFLRRRGFLVLEIGYQQKKLIEPLIDNDWRLVEFFEDLGHNTRGVIVQLNRS